MSKENQIFTLVLGLIALLIGVAWFYKHPSSPYFSKDNYTFEFNQLGTLNTDAKVRVNGLLMGRVVDVSLTEYKAHAHVTLDSEVRLPRDSKVRIVNVGLVGERVLDIKLGQSNNYYQPGDVISGSYDMGSVAIVVTATKALTDLADIVYNIQMVLDQTVYHPGTQQSWKRISRQAKYLSGAITRFREGSTQDFNQFFKGLDSLKTNMVAILEETGAGVDQMAVSGEKLVQTGRVLGEQFGRLGGEIQKLKDAANNPEAGTVYHMIHDQQFESDLDSILVAWGELQEMIYNRRHILNVDVF